MRRLACTVLILFAAACGTEPDDVVVLPPNRIVFLSDTGAYQLMHMDPDGGDRRAIPVVLPAGFAAEPSASRDRLRIAVAVHLGGGPAELFSVNADGSGLTNLTNSAASESEPAWSPDGERIAFTRQVNGELDIFVMNRDGSGLENLTRSPGSDAWPDWSPDGRSIAFASRRIPDAFADIYVLSLSDSSLVRLTTNAENDYDPAWSPGGTAIAFSSDRDFVARPYLMSSVGGGEVAIGPDTLDLYGSLSWSGDGTRLVFECGFREICVIKVDGSGLATIGSGRHPTWTSQ